VGQYNLDSRQLPTEIRKMIFSSAIKIDGLSTGLIAALRPDPASHKEVRETFYKEHIFIISLRGITYKGVFTLHVGFTNTKGPGFLLFIPELVVSLLIN
jgi:hypothetical protein